VGYFKGVGLRKVVLGSSGDLGLILSIYLAYIILFHAEIGEYLKSSSAEA